MQIGILATDGGPHPPEKWAQATVAQIMEIASSAPEALYREATDLERKLIELLAGHHASAQDLERGALSTSGADHLAAPVDTAPHLSSAVADIVELAKGTSFEGHFSTPETQAYLAEVLHSHFHNVKMIERSWHADANPDHPLAKAFRAVASEGHALLTKSDDELGEHGGREAVSAMVTNHSSATAPGV
jgi:hypothetical protein